MADIVLHFPGYPECLPYAILITRAPEGNFDAAAAFARKVIEAGAAAPDMWGRVDWSEIEKGAVRAEIVTD
jgi:hypothetical protein